MDLTKGSECKHDLQMPNNFEKYESNDFSSSGATATTQYSANGFSKVEYGASEYGLQSQKTENVISPERSNSFFLSGSLAQSGSQSACNGSLVRKAMDLSLHIKRNECVRTIFEDADYFARNHSYKLMPITLEAVNETIIHIEHNYCHWASSAGGEADKNLNTTLHVEGEERNYKKRKTKSLAGENHFSSSDYERSDKESSSVDDFVPGSKREDLICNSKAEEDVSLSIQPLDLSLPLVQEQKTDKMLRESQSNIPKTKAEGRGSVEVKQFNMNESNKENVTTPSRKIEVTISRPGQKEYYQPCEVFLNDVARISPDLIRNDCYEIDIIDRTHSQEVESERCRTYYIVSESTWRIFENSTERIILTNDLNIGQPIQNDEKQEKPTYLMFDQYSLTESLAKICEKKGGSFEYTCLEESKELISKAQDNRRETQGKDCDLDGATNEFAVSKVTLEREKSSGATESRKGGGQRNEDREGTGEDKGKSGDFDKKTEKFPEHADILKRLLAREYPSQKGERMFRIGDFESFYANVGGKSDWEPPRKDRERSEASGGAPERENSQSERSETEGRLGDGFGDGELVASAGPDPGMVTVATNEPNRTVQNEPKANVTKVPEDDVQSVETELKCENGNVEGGCGDAKKEVNAETGESSGKVTPCELDAKPEEEPSVGEEDGKDGAVSKEKRSEERSEKPCRTQPSVKRGKKKKKSREDNAEGDEANSTRGKKRKLIGGAEGGDEAKKRRVGTQKPKAAVKREGDGGKVRKAHKKAAESRVSRKNLSDRKTRSSDGPPSSSGKKVKDWNRKGGAAKRENDKADEGTSEAKEDGAGKKRDKGSVVRSLVTTRNGANKGKGRKGKEPEAMCKKIEGKKSTGEGGAASRRGRAPKSADSVQTRSTRKGKAAGPEGRRAKGGQKEDGRRIGRRAKGEGSSGARAGVSEEKQTRSKGVTGRKAKGPVTARAAGARRKEPTGATGSPASRDRRWRRTRRDEAVERQRRGKQKK